MEKIKKTFSIDYELDIINKKIRINGYQEKELREFLDELKRSEDFLAKIFYNDLIEQAVTQMRVMSWTGMDIKQWLNEVGYAEKE
ncbi:MAG: hypothetical protein ACP5KD_06370 [Fervidobacterium sp.]